MMTAERFVSMFSPKEQKKVVQLGKIISNHTSGKPRVIIDGETQASTKRYPYLASYTPTANDRVMLVKGVIIGKIIN